MEIPEQDHGEFEKELKLAGLTIRDMDIGVRLSVPQAHLQSPRLGAHETTDFRHFFTPTEGQKSFEGNNILGLSVDFC